MKLTDYIIVIVQFLVVMFAYNLCAGLLRAIGNSLMPFSVLNHIISIKYRFRLILYHTASYGC